MIASVTFSDIVGQRNSSPPHLATKFILFKIREFPCSCVHSLSKFSSLFVNLEVLKCSKCGVLMFWQLFQLFNLSTLFTSSPTLNDSLRLPASNNPAFAAGAPNESALSRPRLSKSSCLLSQTARPCRDNRPETVRRDFLFSPVLRA